MHETAVNCASPPVIAQQPELIHKALWKNLWSLTVSVAFGPDFIKEASSESFAVQDDRNRSGWNAAFATGTGYPADERCDPSGLGGGVARVLCNWSKLD